MILDRQVLPSQAQAILGAVVLSTDTIDLTVRRNLRTPYPPLASASIVQTTFVGGTGLTIEMVTADDSALTVNLGVVFNSGVIPVANLIAGSIHAQIDVPLAEGGLLRRYLGYRYTPAGTFTAGTITSGLSLDRQAAYAFASGLNVTAI